MEVQSFAPTREIYFGKRKRLVHTKEGWAASGEIHPSSARTTAAKSPATKNVGDCSMIVYSKAGVSR